ncbi:uncharacterized protein KZ484_015789 [Pholidichthys leucotaenia]
MGCQCCRMFKSYPSDPSEEVRKSDAVASSFYQPHRHIGGAPVNDSFNGNNKQKHSFYNLGYSRSNDSTLKLEADNNHVNQRLHRQGSIPPSDGGVYIIQPEAVKTGWVIQDIGPSQVPIYPHIEVYENQRNYTEPEHLSMNNGWGSSIMEGEIASVDEIDEGVGGTPEYSCDTGDEGSVLSVDIHTSTTSLSSGGTRDDSRLPKTPDDFTKESGISVMKSEDEGEEVQSVTDSMVAEALAALEAATAGEEFE